jgi:hypothetical protein
MENRQGLEQVCPSPALGAKIAALNSVAGR